LLKIAFFCKVSLIDLILGRVPEDVGESIPDRSNVQPQEAKLATAVQHWTINKIKKVRQLFEGLLKEDPPLPMMEIRKRLNHPATTLLSRFPDLCRQAVAKYRAHAENRRREFWERVRETLEKQLIEKAPLSVAEVARSAGRSRTAVVRRFPELCARLFTYWNKQRRERWDTVEAFLQDLLENALPLHLKDIANQLKLSHTNLYRYFPQLCHKIAERYALHLQHIRTLKKKFLSDEVRRIAMNLHMQGIYPSVREVSKHLAEPVYLRSSKVALATLRYVRSELGLSFKGGMPTGGING